MLQQYLGIAALCFLWGSLSPALGGMKQAVGFAEGTYPFQVNGKKIERSTTLFDGETVTSALLPTDLSLAGSRFGLGIASQAKVFQKRLVLEGGSLRMTGETSGVAVEAAGLELSSPSKNTVATLYSSRPDRLSIVVESGEVSVLDSAGKAIARATSKGVTTIRDTRDSAKVETSDAPIDVLEIQSKQAEHLGQMEQSVTGAGFTERSRTLLGILAGASGGLVGMNAASDTPVTNAPASTALGANNLALTAASIEVGRQLQSDSTSQAGCSTYRECYPIPVISDNRPYGYVTGVIVLPGCSFCFAF